jgi:uncharacterized protein
MTIRGSLAKIFPYVATMAWAIVAFVAGEVVAMAVLLRLWHGDVRALYAAQYDGIVVALSVLVLDPVAVGVLIFAVHLSGAKPAEYLALVWPRRRMVPVGLIGIVIIIALTDALLFVSGRAIVSDFQVVSYTTAAAEGWLPLMWIATVLVAPAGEEIMFRGYLFRGFVQSERAAWPAIILISLLWAGLHLQYDWTGMAEIGVAGLFLGWVRWRSGSTLLTILLHALFNLEGMLETVGQVKHLF